MRDFIARQVEIAGLSVQIEKPWGKLAHWINNAIFGPMYSVTHDEVMEKLLSFGIDTRPVFYPMHTLPAYDNFRNNFPVADNIASRGINLPSSATLEENEINYICDKSQEII